MDNFPDYRRLVETAREARRVAFSFLWGELVSCKQRLQLAEGQNRSPEELQAVLDEVKNAQQIYERAEGISKFAMEELTRFTKRLIRNAKEVGVAKDERNVLINFLAGGLLEEQIDDACVAVRAIQLHLEFAYFPGYEDGPPEVGLRQEVESNLSEHARKLLDSAQKVSRQILPDPEQIVDLSEERWLIEFDDMLRDEWSQRYRIEVDRRAFAAELVITFGGIESAQNAVRNNLPPTRPLLGLVDTQADALAYVAGNGGPRYLATDVAAQKDREIEKGLTVHDGKLEIYWDGDRLKIDAERDFKTCKALIEANGNIVSHGDLLRVIKPGELSKGVELKAASQETKDAVNHIKSALEMVGCPMKIKAVNRKGYKLLIPD